MKILILGGYGVFGGRLIELLSGHAALDILVCGRSLNKAKAYCAAYDGKSKLTPVAADRADLADALSAYKPDVLIDASGPFQNYGDDPYVVVKACIAAKVNYLDLADDADFVFGITAFDAPAKAAGITVLSGLSSFPVLPAASIAEMSQEMDIRKITSGVAPSPYARLGMNVMRAVASYAGEPIKLRRGGKPATAKGLIESQRETIAPPGHLPMRSVHFSLVDVPDLQILPALYPDVTDVWAGAGTQPEILHRGLNLLAKLRARKLFPPLTPLAGLFHFVLSHVKAGEHRGGLFVRAEGMKDGQPTEMSWHLLAEGDGGPYIPSMASAIIIQNWLAGSSPKAGARSAAGELTLDDFSQLFKARNIHTGFRRQAAQDAGVFAHILGDSLRALPPQMRLLHSGPAAPSKWAGEAQIERAKNPLSKLIARIIGFPSKPGQTPVSVNFSHGTCKRGLPFEIWQRDFGGKTFKSVLGVGRGRNTYMATERFGPITIGMALVRDRDRLFFVPRRWSVFGLPLPRFFMPRGESFEFEHGGVFHFDVEIKMPVIGNIVHYKGWLKPVSSAAALAEGTSKALVNPG